MLTPHYRSESMVYIRFAFGVAHAVGFDRCVMTCPHRYGITQDSLTALHALCALPVP